MAAYSDDERRELQDVPIEDVLKVFGRSTEHGRDNLYFSPWHPCSVGASLGGLAMLYESFCPS